MTKNKSLNFLLQTLGCLISAAGIYSFAVAAGIPVTGVAGISAILYRLFGVPMGLSNVLINIPIILCTYKLLGRAFFLRSVYCMILFAISTDYVLPLLPVYQGDRLLATICAGVVGGIGDALIYMNNSSTGGLDFITMAIKARHPYLAFGNLTFAAALAVIVLSGAVFRDVDAIIYGIMFNFLVSTVINKMMFGFTSSMLAMIITDDGARYTNIDYNGLDFQGTNVIRSVFPCTGISARMERDGQESYPPVRYLCLMESGDLLPMNLLIDCHDERFAPDMEYKGLIIKE